jgi:phosphatidylglycerophosphatase C
LKKEIALFDFDGTITTKDTLFQFIKCSKGLFWFYLGFMLNLPFLIAFKLGLISNQAAKEKVLKFFFHNTPAHKFEHFCSQFSTQVLPTLVRPKAILEINKLKARNVLVVVVSASPENWIEGWARQNGLEVIASRLEILNGRITGKLIGKNCSDDEKVNRVNESFDLSQFRVVAAYGDSNGDKAMLRLADRGYYKYFH